MKKSYFITFSQITISCFFYDQRGIKKSSGDKNSSEMSDLGVDQIDKKNPDEKYYFVMEKS